MTTGKCVLCFVWFMAVWLAVNGQYAPLSPCPKVYIYENDGQQWYGTIKVTSPPYGSEMKLKVSLSLGATLPTNYTGSVELVGERGRILLNILKGLPITYKVNFPLLTPLPKITKIIFNEKVICTGPSETIRNGVKSVTEITLNHVLKTGEGDNNSSYRPQETPMEQDGRRPNPDNFAQPRPQKPQKPSGFSQSAPGYVTSNNDEAQLSNELPTQDVWPQERPQTQRPDKNNYPQMKPVQNSNSYGSDGSSIPAYLEIAQTVNQKIPQESRPAQQDENDFETDSSNAPPYLASYVPPQNNNNKVVENRPMQNTNNYGTVISGPSKIPNVPVTIPILNIPPTNQKPITSVVSGSFDTYHDSIKGTSNVLPDPDLLSNKPIVPPPNVMPNGQPQTVYNYQLSQDRNVSKTEVYHGTQEHQNQPYNNYYYHEVNKSETVVNRFSYQWTQHNPVYVAPQQTGQVATWKDTNAENQGNVELQHERVDIADKDYEMQTLPKRSILKKRLF